MPDKTYARYMKPGEYLAGVPARDMTKDEWQALPETLRAAALVLGLYELPAKGSKEGDK